MHEVAFLVEPNVAVMEPRSVLAVNIAKLKAKPKSEEKGWR